MSVIGKPEKAPLNPRGNINIPAMEVPSFRYLLAEERKTLRNVLIMSPFALGDCVCAEPVIRFAVKNFKECNVSLYTPFPQLYRHIGLKKLFGPKEKPNWDEFYVLKSYYDAEELQSEFTQNFNMAIGDYIATCVLKGHLPTQDRNIQLHPLALENMPKKKVVVHAGRHWSSKTFPVSYWNAILTQLVCSGITPVLIGAVSDDLKRGFVDVDTTGCEDLRNKLSIMQSVSLLQNADVVLTNDSAPYHMAASGSAHIGVLSTVRPLDYIGHWRPNHSIERKNEWNYRIENLAKNQMWQDTDVSPIRNGSKYDSIDEATLLTWLPDPREVVSWTMTKINGRT